jgi:hypothetical protein
MLKMYTGCGKWIVVDKRRLIIFDTSYDAWAYVMMLKEIRPRVPMGERSLYPVKSLDPRPERRLKNVRLHT